MAAISLREKKEEFGSFLLALVYVVLQGIVAATMSSVYQLLGIPKQKRTLAHAEVFLVATTLIFICLIAAAQFWPSVGWVILILGNIRILQIVSLNLITVIFDFSPISSAEESLKRARWHFVAIWFSLADAVMIFAYMFQFFDARWQILNQHGDDFVHYFYYSLVTMATVGYGDITPVTLFGRLLAMYEIVVSLFFMIFVVAGAFGRLQKHG